MSPEPFFARETLDGFSQALTDPRLSSLASRSIAELRAGKGVSISLEPESPCCPPPVEQPRHEASLATLATSLASTRLIGPNMEAEPICRCESYMKYDLSRKEKCLLWCPACGAIVVNGIKTWPYIYDRLRGLLPPERENNAH